MNIRRELDHRLCTGSGGWSILDVRREATPFPAIRRPPIATTPPPKRHPYNQWAPDARALDLVGDLALLGKPLLGHVIAERAGHAMHTALVARIMSDSSLYEILTFDQLASRVTQALIS